MAEEVKQEKPSKMTDDERLQLVEKLEEDLETYMNSLEKKPYLEGWPEESWEQEMEKHPFFMTKSLENSDDVPPLLQGIQQLKYDENENTPLELAQSYKEDGNFNFKHKKYRMAIISYTEGLRRNCGDPLTDAALFNNRAAAHYYLGNYGSCLTDCEECLKRNNEHIKARIRAAECSLKLRKPDEVIRHCDIYFQKNSDDPFADELRRKAIKLKKEILRDERKALREESRVEKSISDLENAIKCRNIRVISDITLDTAQESPKLLHGDILAWPVFFLYPEHSMSDFVEQFCETDTLSDMLNEIFDKPPSWDTERKYITQNLSVYYEGEDRSKLYCVDISNTLATILSSKTLVVRDWKPAFLVMVRGSRSERNFLQQYTVFL